MSASTPELKLARDRATWSLFVVSIFSSAFLIFLVQPMVGKRILPWFGGSPGVWTLCLAFYQSALFVGYAYAHLLIRYTSPSLQVAVHALVVTAALVTLPVLPGDVWRPDGQSGPTASILAMLSGKVALPFITLAATGPLIQAWFSRRYPERSPYPLYAVSNAGSLLALISYPFLIEPRLPLSSTGEIWTLAFAVTAAAVLACSLLAWRPGTGLLARRPPALLRDDASPPFVHVTLWFLLSGCAVITLMGVTNSLCLDIASVPFLWILPLVAYLASLILCFGSERAYRRTPYVAAAAFCVLSPVWEPWLFRFSGVMLQTAQTKIALHCALLFSVCMLMHGELYRIRPSPRSLTLFYLCITGGGALGGIFVGVIAQHIFERFYEQWVGIGLAWGLLLVACRMDPSSWLQRAAVRWRWGLVLSLTAAGLLYFEFREPTDEGTIVHRERTFFGILHVIDKGTGINRQRWLSNGTTMHGVQFIASPKLRRRSSSYYGVATGIGVALNQDANGPPRRVGVIGLGTGTLATYARPGDRFRFYEIDPAVIRIAGENGYFSFLADSPGEIEVVTGDGRLLLERELKQGTKHRYDFLIIDAFNSDAIPVHLLTREAFEIYSAATKKNGLIAVHISNRHFELAPLVGRAGLSAGLGCMVMENEQVAGATSGTSRWVFLSADPSRIDELYDAANRSRFRPETVRRCRSAALRDVALWTDDYSDLFGALRAEP